MNSEDHRVTREGNELGADLVRTMHAWADKRGSGETNPMMPLIAIQFALARTLELLPPDRRRRYAEKFVSMLDESLKAGAN